MADILILANNDIGLYKFRKELIEELINRDNHIYISLPDGEFIQSLVDIGCTFIDTCVDRRGINPITDFKLIVSYLKIINKLRPDMVITYTVKPNIYGGIASRLKKVPYSINITGLGTAFNYESLLKKFVIHLYKIACKKAKIVFFENEENQQIFIKNKIVKQENTCKLNGAGVNLEEYKFCEYPKDDKEIRFLFIGRIMKEKGVDELFQVAKRIKYEYNNVVFDIVGPFEDRYEDIINELVKQDIIKFYGYQADVKPFIKEAHCFLLPSYHEGMANTLLESGAVGRPLITSNIHGCKEAVLDGKSGYLVNAKDSDDMYEKIKSFIELPCKNKLEMALLSRKLIESKFDKKVIVNKTMLELYKYIKN